MHETETTALKLLQQIIAGIHSPMRPSGRDGEPRCVVCGEWADSDNNEAHESDCEWVRAKKFLAEQATMHDDGWPRLDLYHMLGRILALEEWISDHDTR